MSRKNIENGAVKERKRVCDRLKERGGKKNFSEIKEERSVNNLEKKESRKGMCEKSWKR